MWAKDPVVAFSIALGAVGLSLPLFVPNLRKPYPDTQIMNEIRKQDELDLAAAKKKYGTLTTLSTRFL